MRARNKKQARRGMAIVVVLGLLAVTMALSYALLRTQGIDHQLERNAFRTGDAEAAAQVGMAVALRKMHDGTWGGADSTFAGQVAGNSLQGYTVTYSTGDSSLTAASADYNEYPYRVTIVVNGYAIDPVTSASRSDYAIKAVAQLVRRKLNNNSVSDSTLDSYSFYQTSNNAVRIHHPMRLEGNVWLQGQLTYCDQYPLAIQGTAYNRYMDDLYDLYRDGVGDYRTFGGTIYSPSSRQPGSGDLKKIVVDKLQTPWVKNSISSTTPLTMPTSVTSYRLYPGGATYQAQTLSLSTDVLGIYPTSRYLPSGTYGANPLTNPLGFYSATSLDFTIPSGTTINGVVFALGSSTLSDIHVSGSSIALTSPTLPALSGDSTIYKLPLLLAADDVRLWDGESRSINGLVVASDEFQVVSGASSAQVSTYGPVICSKLYLDDRQAWRSGTTLWTLYLTAFDLANTQGNNLYFPKWLGDTQFTLGFFLNPKLVFNPQANGVKTHVPSDWSQPIYVADTTNDGGLLWNIVSWHQPYSP